MKIGIKKVLKKYSVFCQAIRKSGVFWLFLFVIFILILSVRGIPGTPTSEELNLDKWAENGPFELSPERGRYALIYSIIEDKSLFFSQSVARFSIPDLGYHDGKFVPRFAPTVSFLAIPGYLLGRTFNLSQVGTFLVIALFALANTLLVRAIAIKFGAKPLAATIGSLVFLFASPSFTYAVTLYQHHISTFIILFALYILIRYKGYWSVAFVCFLCGLSITVDYPNFFLMLPIGLTALARGISVKSGGGKLKFNVQLTSLLSVTTVVIPLILLFWYNQEVFSNPFQLSGTVPGVRDFDEQGRPLAPRNVNPKDLEKYLHPETQEKSALGFFLTRNLMHGLYTHFFSPDRGILFFTPIILLGILGIVLIYKERNKHLRLFIGVLGMNILLYSMWGDPWGGWAFGSRYIIPSYALLSIFIGVALSKYNRNIPFTLLFLILFSYSAFVNTAGALSSSANPPKVEVLELEKLSGMVQKYTSARNLDYLKNDNSKSFVYNTFTYRHLSAWNYFVLVYALILAITLIPLLYFSIPKWDLPNKVMGVLKRIKINYGNKQT